MDKRVALVTGVGPGTGTAIVKRFAAGGYRVAMLARTAERLHELEQEVSGSRGYVCDVTDTAALAHTLAAVRAEMGDPEILVHNAVRGTIGTFADIDPAAMEKNFQVNVMALLHLARALTPAMIAAGHGAVIVTGNTSALRGKPAFSGLAPTKAAQRILAESIARDLGPKGVHVAYLVIDAVIDMAWTRERFKDRPDDFFIKPAAIADEIWHLAHQDRSAWSFLTELRPFGESW